MSYTECKTAKIFYPFKNEAKEQKGGFFGMLLGAFGAIRKSINR